MIITKSATQWHAFDMRCFICFVLCASVQYSSAQSYQGDLDNDGCVTSSDLSILLQDFGNCLPDTMPEDSIYLDIIPQVNWLYLDVYTGAPKLEVNHIIKSSNDTLTYDHIKDEVQTYWYVNGVLTQQSVDFHIAEAVEDYTICSGAFPLRIVLIYNDKVYLRDYVARVNFVGSINVPECEYYDENGELLVPTTFEEAYYDFELFEFCVNCE